MVITDSLSRVQLDTWIQLDLKQQKTRRKYRNSNFHQHHRWILIRIKEGSNSRSLVVLTVVHWAQSLKNWMRVALLQYLRMITVLHLNPGRLMEIRQRINNIKIQFKYQSMATINPGLANKQNKKKELSGIMKSSSSCQRVQLLLLWSMKHLLELKVGPSGRHK